MKYTHKLHLAVFLFAVLLLNGCIQPEPTVSSFEGNQSPIIKKLSADRLGIKSGEITTIIVDAVDPDGEELNYSWVASLGDIIGYGAVVRYTATFCCLGVNAITVTVTDSRGASVSQTINIEIFSR